MKHWRNIINLPSQSRAHMQNLRGYIYIYIYILCYGSVSIYDWAKLHPMREDVNVSSHWLRPCSTLHTLQWRHNEHDGVSNLQPHHCLLNRLFGRWSKNTSKLRVGNSPTQMASNAENVFIWWRHHVENDPCNARTFHIMHAIDLVLAFVQSFETRW